MSGTVSRILKTRIKYHPMCQQRKNCDFVEDMTLCTLGLILFAHFVRNYLKMMKDAKKPLKKQRQKELLVTVYVIWSVVISLCRFVAALTPGGFTKHYLGRRC